MKENEFSWLGKGATTLGIVILAVVALFRISRGEVANPVAFGITGVGFVLFVIAKASVLRRRKWISFGTSAMTPSRSNMYRFGYWLMAVGILATFA